VRRYAEWLLLPLAVLPAAGLLAFVLWARAAYLAEVDGTGTDVLHDAERAFGVDPAEATRRFLAENGYDARPGDVTVHWTTTDGQRRDFRVRGLGDVPDPWTIVDGPLPGLPAKRLADPETRVALEAGTPASGLPGATGGLASFARLIRGGGPGQLAAAPLPAATKLYLLPRCGPADPGAAERLREVLALKAPPLPGVAGPAAPGVPAVVRAGPGREPLLLVDPATDAGSVLTWVEPERGRLALRYDLRPWGPTPTPASETLWTVWSDVPCPGRWSLVAPHGACWWEDPAFRRWLGPTALGGLGLTALPLLLWLELRRRRRLDEARVRFLGEVAHDLRTPLSALRVHADLLAQDRLPEERRANSAHRVAREAGRLSALLANLLDLTRLERGTRSFESEPLDLREVVEEAARDFRLIHAERASDLRVTVEDGARVEADRTALRRALDNLLDNAAKYTPPGTPVSVSGGADASDVRVTVADEGPGIPAGERSRLFERYHRGRGAREGGVAGSGLGLALVRELARGMGGDVELEDSERGARFALRLRRAP